MRWCTRASAAPWPRAAGAARQQAVEALGQRVPACAHCRPDTALSIVDQLRGLTESGMARLPGRRPVLAGRPEGQRARHDA
ncbi:DUF6233 domain-containing protein [Streptomyces longwoodensis]|nr:DUF6233 domain-containing protein [Streptomyces longwoodensis]